VVPPSLAVCPYLVVNPTSPLGHRRERWGPGPHSAGMRGGSFDWEGRAHRWSEVGRVGGSEVSPLARCPALGVLSRMESGIPLSPSPVIFETGGEWVSAKGRKK
jgi:hypothetical protein